jgi:hypothetical protein
VRKTSISEFIRTFKMLRGNNSERTDYMDYIKDAYARMDLPKLRSFLLYGQEDFSEDVTPYSETLQQRSDPIYKRLETLYPDSKELDRADADLSDALTAYQNVYMELGMKAGARLIFQLLFTDDRSAANGTCGGNENA